MNEKPTISLWSTLQPLLLLWFAGIVARAVYGGGVSWWLVLAWPWLAGIVAGLILALAVFLSPRKVAHGRG